MHILKILMYNFNFTHCDSIIIQCRCILFKCYTRLLECDIQQSFNYSLYFKKVFEQIWEKSC